jgi:hypothetical protein
MSFGTRSIHREEEDRSTIRRHGGLLSKEEKLEENRSGGSFALHTSKGGVTILKFARLGTENCN